MFITNMFLCYFTTFCYLDDQTFCNAVNLTIPLQLLNKHKNKATGTSPNVFVKYNLTFNAQKSEYINKYLG